MPLCKIKIKIKRINYEKKKRDLNIVKNYKREISLQTKVVRDRTKYTRKQKHKKVNLHY